MVFDVLKGTTDQGTPRLGRLSCKGRSPIDTPHYVGTTSRGVVPHISPDNVFSRTKLSAVYIALEDFVEKAPTKVPPILSEDFLHLGFDLRTYISLPEDQLVILAARRAPPVQNPNPNTIDALAISTAVGFRKLAASDYINACNKLQPDVVIGLGDIPYGTKPGPRRLEKLSSHTERWMQATVEARRKMSSTETRMLLPELFAPIIPVPPEQQYIYLEALTDDLLQHIAGLAIYDVEFAVKLPDPLTTLPRLYLGEPANPQDILRNISLGIDLQTIPFVGTATDAGIALTFRFLTTADRSSLGHSRDLGIDMWESAYNTDLGPLVRDCDCNVCLKHHRAYVTHLLSAKEMLAWVLLQIHNLRVMERFFHEIRRSLKDDSFEESHNLFCRCYKKAFPERTGQGPRVRGYQFKSAGGEAKRNNPPYKRLESER